METTAGPEERPTTIEQATIFAWSQAAPTRANAARRLGRSRTAKQTEAAGHCLTPALLELDKHLSAAATPVAIFAA